MPLPSSLPRTAVIAMASRPPPTDSLKVVASLFSLVALASPSSCDKGRTRFQHPPFPRRATITTIPCRSPWRGYTLTWRATLRIRNGELHSYTVRYDFSRPRAGGPENLQNYRQNHERIDYVGASWWSPEKGAYRSLIHRAIPKSRSVYVPDVLYVLGVFDTPGEDQRCMLAINLKTHVMNQVPIS